MQSCMSCVIIQVRVVFRKTVVDDWCFNYLRGTVVIFSVKWTVAIVKIFFADEDEEDEDDGDDDDDDDDEHSKRSARRRRQQRLMRSKVGRKN